MPFSRLLPIERTFDHPARLAWRSFLAEANWRRLSVLELGSRRSVLGDIGTRHRFKRASAYVGVDIHAGEGVDVVGDIHALSTVLNGRQFQAIHSHSVIEHLAMPWVAAVEMIKSLEVGGIMFHHVPMNWPEHELPWDFHRFTQATFGVYFPRAFGVEIEYVGFDHPLHLHMEAPPPGQQDFHQHRCFAFAAALIRKTREVDLSSFVWPITLRDLLGGSLYPKG